MENGTPVDWAARAREITVEFAGRPASSGSVSEQAEKVLRLGREMADARAEEIARKCERWRGLIERQEHTTSEEHAPYERGIKSGLATAGSIARSFISKPKPREIEVDERTKAAIRAAESRPKYEERFGASVECCGYRIQWACPDSGLWRCACPHCGARYVHPDSGLTREQVLEGALEKIFARYSGQELEGAAIAREALGWKP